ncbi:hypothetical protein [Clostridium tertium]|uniref:Uncharacterized protein n=1 Tax=Clostridium tertium TaxID=1559 RepID=A0A6N3FHP2_9CLOT
MFKKIFSMFSDTITKFENKYDVEFSVRPQDITSEIVNVNSEWLNDANLFVESFNNTTIPQNARVTTSQANSEALAKTDAIMYSINRATFSIQRNPSLSFSKEAQYMFVSHYIDRYEYYWSTEDERLLLDGPSLSGEDGYLASIV